MSEAPENVYRAGINRDPSILVMATAAIQLAVRESPTPEHVAAAVIEAIEPVINAAAYASGREAAAQAVEAWFVREWGESTHPCIEVARGGSDA